MSKKKSGNFVLIIIILLITALIWGLVFYLMQTSDKEKHKEIKQEQKVEKEPINLPPYERYKYNYTFDFNVKGKVNNFDCSIMIPDNEKYTQRIYDLKITPQPSSIEKENGNLKANYKISNLNSGIFKIKITGIADLRTYNINLAKKINKNNTVETDLSKYLNPEKYIESDDEYIKDIANQIQGNSREEILQNTYEYIQNHMTYRISQSNVSAKEALKRGWGKCSEYSAVMIAILRAKNIPARIVSGNIAREKDSLHNWVEVYYDEYGWVTYDPTFLPTEIVTLGQNKQIIKKQKRYDVSHDDVQYIKSGVNDFSSFRLYYSTEGKNSGNITFSNNIKIEKISK